MSEMSRSDIDETASHPSSLRTVVLGGCFGALACSGFGAGLGIGLGTVISHKNAEVKELMDSEQAAQAAARQAYDACKKELKDLRDKEDLFEELARLERQKQLNLERDRNCRSVDSTPCYPVPKEYTSVVACTEAHKAVIDGCKDGIAQEVQSWTQAQLVNLNLNTVDRDTLGIRVLTKQQECDRLEPSDY